VIVNTSNSTSLWCAVGSTGLAFRWPVERRCPSSPHSAPNVPDFFAHLGPPFRSGIRLVSRLTGGSGSVPVLVPAAHINRAYSVATGHATPWRKCLTGIVS
jgi:hypothetical protein